MVEAQSSFSFLPFLPSSLSLSLIHFLFSFPGLFRLDLFVSQCAAVLFFPSCFCPFPFFFFFSPSFAPPRILSASFFFSSSFPLPLALRDCDLSDPDNPCLNFIVPSAASVCTGQEIPSIGVYEYIDTYIVPEERAATRSTFQAALKPPGKYQLQVCLF